MIQYKYPEEKIVAVSFALLLNDETTQTILEKGFVASRNEAIHLSQFFWRMIENLLLTMYSCNVRVARNTGQKNYITQSVAILKKRDTQQNGMKR